MNRNLKIILFGLMSFIFLLSGVSADEKSSLIGKAAAPYMMSTHYMSTLSRTKCGYAIKHKYNGEAVEKEVFQVLRPIDRTQLNAILTSKKYRDDLTHQVQEVRNMLESIKANGIDDKTACGIVIGMALCRYAQALNGWTAAVQEYKK